MTDLIKTPSLSGRALSQARRKAMSKTGAATIKSSGGRTRPSRVNVAKTSVSAGQSVVAAEPVTSVVTSPVQPSVSSVSVKALSGSALSRARRAMLSRNGKASIPGANKPARPTRARPVKAVVNKTLNEVAGLEENNMTENSLVDVCNLIKANPSEEANVSNSVKSFCRDRRKSLSQKGKMGLTGKAGKKARKEFIRSANTSSSLASSSLTGRDLAKLRREESCTFGKNSSVECRPSGRVRPNVGEAPSKVEVGTTLSGQSVSGTQVEQTDKITGAESGSCRDITGTEYLGVEQFNNLCSATPKQTVSKVIMSETAQGQSMTGSSVALGNKITGGEAGDCQSVTGSDYLGTNSFNTGCPSSSVVKSTVKVVEGVTSKSMRITGADEARDNAVTGTETGSGQNVTGSDYVNMSERTKMNTSPTKVGLSHTATGNLVSGGDSSKFSGVTGDNQNTCNGITGTEYMSSEKFQSVCGSQPATPVAKVAVDSSQAGMTITGNLVDRDNKVTGNEPGTCQRVTGSQYDISAKKGFCEQRTKKVNDMHTLSGRSLTGTEVSFFPKLEGDEQGNCLFVTGTEYVSKERFQQSCSQVPMARAEKTPVSHTWNDQPVSGTKPLFSESVTGVEKGLCSSITGNNYSSKEQVSQLCDLEAVANAEELLRRHYASQSVSGIVPSADERIAGNFQKGQTQHVSGTPYQVVTQHGGVSSYETGFTVQSPARAAWQKRTNKVFDVNGSITGSANKAEGIVSGTPEFRHSQDVVVDTVKVEAEPQVKRITGEGSNTGTSITGDDWSRGGLVTGTEGDFSANRNQTQRGGEFIKAAVIGAHELKDRERMEVRVSRVTGSSGGTSNVSSMVTLSGGACG